MYSFFNKIDIQLITERSEANTEIRYFWPTIPLISGKGRPQEKRISKFLNIHKKNCVLSKSKNFRRSLLGEMVKQVRNKNILALWAL